MKNYNYDGKTVIDVDNDGWYKLNEEYFKMRELQYESKMHPIIQTIRDKANALIHTKQFLQIERDWSTLVHMDRH